MIPSNPYPREKAKDLIKETLLVAFAYPIVIGAVSVILFIAKYWNVIQNYLR